MLHSGHQHLESWSKLIGILCFSRFSHRIPIVMTKIIDIHKVFWRHISILFGLISFEGSRCGNRQIKCFFFHFYPFFAVSQSKIQNGGFFIQNVFYCILNKISSMMYSNVLCEIFDVIHLESLMWNIWRHSFGKSYVKYMTSFIWKVLCEILCHSLESLMWNIWRHSFGKSYVKYMMSFIWKVLCEIYDVIHLESLMWNIMSFIWKVLCEIYDVIHLESLMWNIWCHSFGKSYVKYMTSFIWKVLCEILCHSLESLMWTSFIWKVLCEIYDVIHLESHCYNA